MTEYKDGQAGLINPSAYVRDNTVIEPLVEIAEMACVGSRGMTLKRNKYKRVRWRRKGSDYPVILRWGCYIGARSIIMRGTKWNTVIGNNTFIGPNVSIGHDVVIGESCIILNGTIICGSVKVGNYCYIAPGVMIRDNISIGDDSFIKMGSQILKDFIPKNSKKQLFGDEVANKS